MRPSRVLANIVGGMLFVQVILGGSAVLLKLDIGYHIVWGLITLIVLLATVGLAARDYGRKSTLVKVGLAAIADFFVQVLLGLAAFGSDFVVVIHLTNAFLLAVLITYLISFTDRADKAAMSAVQNPAI